MLYFVFSRAGDSDVDSSDLDKRKRKDKDGESSKSKKKHKKHKKNKKSKKHDVDGKERIKKHKKHHKRSKSIDESGSNTESTPAAAAATVAATVKTRCDPTSSALSRQSLETKLPPQLPLTTLNTKFTEIMKSNGHVPKPLPKFNNGNGAECSSASSKRNDNVHKIPTDPSKLVEFITKSLDPNTSTQVVSSASESDTVNDVDSPDVAVIEDDEDLNLEELMRQKALLQARLGGIPMSDTESENSHKTPASLTLVHKALVVDAMKINEKEREKNKETEKDKLKRRAEPVNDVILLDDSSNDACTIEKPPSPPKKKVRSSRSRSREHKNRNSSNSSRNVRDNRDTRENDKVPKNRRSDTMENRFKEDLRREIDRDKERTQRQNTSVKPGNYSPNSKAKPPPAASEKSKTQTSFREREVNDVE